MAGAIESAIIAKVPEAEPVIGALRTRYDPAAAHGVPAHITILYPFAPPQRIARSMLEEIRAIAARTRPFSYCLREIRQFPEILYLVPDPLAPFESLTAALASHFPEFPPYRRRYPGVLPHLTVAHGDRIELQHVEHKLRAEPLFRTGISAQCTALTLIDNASGRWRDRHSFPFAAAPV